MIEPDATARFLAKRRRLRRIGGGVVVTLLLLSLADHLGLFGSTIADFDRFDGTRWSVKEVLDGDTLILTNTSRDAVRFHLLGVDAPEAGAHWFDRARNYATARSLNRQVTITLDGTESRDQANELRGYVHLSDNETLNIAMIRDGQAYADRRVQHTFARMFEQAETVVRKKESGIWKGLRFNDMPQWRQDWLNAIGEARRGGSKQRGDP